MEMEEPVSPTGQYLSSSVLSVCILAVFDTEIPIDVSEAFRALENVFLPLNPRFSSIMVREEHGVPKWRRVRVKLEDHVKIPVFPDGLELYDDYLQDYISKIAMEPLPRSRPLWDIHFVKYPTSNAAGNFLFKLHHALGDGYSLMAALFACLKRADDPSLPLTFPSSCSDKPVQNNKLKLLNGLARAASAFVNTVDDFCRSVLKSSFMEDSESAIRSALPGVDSQPITLSYVTFSLDDIKRIKQKVEGTVNDVLVGVVFYGIHLYLQEASPGTETAQLTALVLLNTRAIHSYQSMQEMQKPNSLSRWGNQFAFLHISIPNCGKPNNDDPLQFVINAKKVITAKKSSLAIYLTAGLLETMRRLRGAEVASRYVFNTLRNSSTVISNMIGPMEQVKMAGHPVKGMHFMIVRAPQSLTTTIVSYMGNVRLALGAEKGFINSELLLSCMNKSFARIFEAAVGNAAG